MDQDIESVRLMTLAEAAELLHVSTRTVQRMIRAKNLPALKVGSQWRLRESQLRRWLLEHESRSAAGQ
jgi:excisionase family DNA binding protein